MPGLEGASGEKGDKGNQGFVGLPGNTGPQGKSWFDFSNWIFQYNSRLISYESQGWRN